MAAYKAKRLKEIEGLDILIINEMKAGKCLEDRSCLSTKEVSSQIFWDKTEDSIRYLFRRAREPVKREIIERIDKAKSKLQNGLLFALQ